MDNKEWYEKIWKANINELTGETYYTVSDEEDKMEGITMSKKFTEEQFKKLVKIQEKYFPISTIDQGASGKSPYDAIHESSIKLSDFIWIEKLGNEAVAIINPVTREWAHEQFVEKEKKYVWRDKYTGYVIYKMLNDWSLSATALGEKHFTETELENSPFKHEWFDKEEVD